MPIEVKEQRIVVFKEFRRDGWPLCPRCKEDELYSALAVAGEYSERRVYLHILSGMNCYRCHWSLLPGMLIEDEERYDSLWPGSIRPISRMPSSPASIAG